MPADTLGEALLPAVRVSLWIPAMLLAPIAGAVGLMTRRSDWGNATRRNACTAARVGGPVVAWALLGGACCRRRP